jgi:hypothetical protein
LIIEVKSWRELREDGVERSFSPERVKTALYRFGIFPCKDVLRIHEDLLKQKYVRESSCWTIASISCKKRDWRELA